MASGGDDPGVQLDRHGVFPVAPGAYIQLDARDVTKALQRWLEAFLPEVPGCIGAAALLQPPVVPTGVLADRGDRRLDAPTTPCGCYVDKTYGSYPYWRKMTAWHRH